MTNSLRKFHLAAFVALLGLGCRHENVVGEEVELRARCAGMPLGSVVSDFESGTPAILPIDGRGGFWALATNSGAGAPGLSMEVKADPTAPHGKEVLWVHGTASNVLRYLQGRFSASPTHHTYDISDCTALEIRARWSGGTANPVILSIGDVHTVPEGGICGVGDGGACHDDFAVTLPLSPAWQDLQLAFDQFHQTGFGRPYPSLATTMVYGPQFIFPAGEAVDLSIDDLTLR
jgi:hypothetical protein